MFKEFFFALAFQKPTIKTTRTTTTRRPTTTRIQPVDDDDCWKNCNNHTDMCTCSNICRVNLEIKK
jgi:hypothetical protein